jgi:hypothetical protein
LPFISIVGANGGVALVATFSMILYKKPTRCNITADNVNSHAAKTEEIMKETVNLDHSKNAYQINLR